MKKLSKKKQELKVAKKQSGAEAPPDKEKTFNYGGLPDRDLKKNLGC